MAQFSVNARRFDPYKNFKFRVKWDGKYVAGVSKVGALKRSTEVVEHREGGDPSSGRKSPGRSKFEAITLERGVTHDKEFEQWANKVWNYGSGLGAEASLKDFRKDIIIELYNEAGQLAIAYKVYRCWVSEFQAQPDLDANANAIAIQTIKLENEGQAQATVPNPRVKVSGQMTVQQPNPWMVAACPFVSGTNPLPCVTAQWSTGAMRVKSGGMPLLLQDSQAVCAPNGTGVNIMVTQTRVRAQ